MGHTVVGRDGVDVLNVGAVALAGHNGQVVVGVEHKLAAALEVLADTVEPHAVGVAGALARNRRAGRNGHLIDVAVLKQVSRRPDVANGADLQDTLLGSDDVGTGAASLLSL